MRLVYALFLAHAAPLGLTLPDALRDLRWPETLLVPGVRLAGLILLDLVEFPIIIQVVLHRVELPIMVRIL